MVTWAESEKKAMRGERSMSILKQAFTFDLRAHLNGLSKPRAQIIINIYENCRFDLKIIRQVTLISTLEVLIF